MSKILKNEKNGNLKTPLNNCLLPKYHSTLSLFSYVKHKSFNYTGNAELYSNPSKLNCDF